MTITDLVAVHRVLDANLNRGMEGLRVLEDLARFSAGDRFLSARLKSLRHELATAAARLDQASLLAARDTQGDVGTTLSLPTEQQRGNWTDLLQANFSRVQQALRSLEEFGKLVDLPFALACEQLRYTSYTLEKAFERGQLATDRLSGAQLYVLLDGRASEAEFIQLAREMVTAGAHVIQLRDKQLDDRTLLARARRLREITRAGTCLCIVNDRPDLAVLAEADGVHVGQDELTVADVRRVVGTGLLIGVSTHSLAQARAAVLDGADYIGCGPTFPSHTKSFEAFTGLDLLREVAAEIALPAFAIGGIDERNLPSVLQSGFSRVAVSGAVISSPDPAAATVRLLRLLGGE